MTDAAVSKLETQFKQRGTLRARNSHRELSSFSR